MNNYPIGQAAKKQSRVGMVRSHDAGSCRLHRGEHEGGKGQEVARQTKILQYWP
jgi:hypothetical protein